MISPVGQVVAEVEVVVVTVSGWAQQLAALAPRVEAARAEVVEAEAVQAEAVQAEVAEAEVAEGTEPEALVQVDRPAAVEVVQVVEVAELAEVAEVAPQAEGAAAQEEVPAAVGEAGRPVQAPRELAAGAPEETRPASSGWSKR